MSVNVEVVAVANMHGVNNDVTVGKALAASGKLAIDTHAGLVLDDLIGKFASVFDPAASAPSPSAADCRELAAKLVQAKLGSNYSIPNAPIDMTGVHIWVRGEGWVVINPLTGFSHAFQLRIASTLGPVDQKSVFYVNGRLLAVDILIVVQTP